MVVRTTPKRFQSRDAELFPALDRARRLYGSPDYYSVRGGCSRVFIEIDAFFVAPEIQNRLSGFYQDYARWWFNKSNPARHRAPGSLLIPTFHDYVGIFVLREHAEWWIELFNQAAVFTYDPWRLQRESNLDHQSHNAVVQ